MSQRKTYRQPPMYPVEAVDNALVLLEMLRDLGSVTLTEAARELEVSPSTIHRLMAMLVYRGFAEQGSSRRYIPGPSMGTAPAGLPWTAELRRVAQPHLEMFADQIDEAINLMVRAGTHVRFLATAPGSRPLGVGDRQGSVMPAEKASAGKAILATLPTFQIQELYSRRAQDEGHDLDQDWFASFESELQTIRRRGFAGNFEGTEDGICAIGVAVSDGAGHVVGGLSVAVPMDRFREVYEAGLVPQVLSAKSRLEADLSDFNADGG